MKKKIKIGICFMALAVMLLLLTDEAEASCNGTIGECGAKEEFAMDSEIHRRILQGQKHIVYPALNPDRPVCNSGSGMPYGGNCLPAPSNPYHRGCDPYYGCRGGGGKS